MSFLKLFSSSFSQKILSSTLILSFFVSALFLILPARQANAQWVVSDPITEFNTGVIAAVETPAAVVTSINSTSFNLKKFLLDGIAWTLAKIILRTLTAQTVNWINSGFNGNPAYVTDPGQFFTDAADQTVGQALASQGGLLSKICTPFQPQIRLALVATYLQQNQLGQCTLSQIIANYSAFTQNFQNGGWEGWFSVSQSMQNNPYGSYLQAQDELSISIANQTNKYQKQLDWGQGFLSFEKCTAGGTFTGPLQPGQTAPNSSNCQTVTPGTVIADQLKSSLSYAGSSLVTADEINEIINALLLQAVKGIVGGISSGLRGLSQGSSGNSSITSQLMTGSPQAVAADATSLSNIQAGLPSNLAQATNPNATSTSLTPIINTTSIANQVNAQVIAIQTGTVLPPLPGSVGGLPTGTTGGSGTGTGGTGGGSAGLSPFNSSIIGSYSVGCQVTTSSGGNYFTTTCNPAAFTSLVMGCMVMTTSGPTFTTTCPGP